MEINARENDDMAGQQAWDPFQELQRIQDRLNRIFGDLAPSTHGQGGMQGMEVPSVDVQEHNGEIIVTADMPGMDKEDIKLDVTSNNVLEISARKKSEKKEGEEKKGYLRHERSYVGYYRAIQLPADVDKSKAKAAYSNGVLSVTMPIPKKLEEKTSAIPIS
jgi:Molecular chaperone (small heat shock protein)